MLFGEGEDVVPDCVGVSVLEGGAILEERVFSELLFDECPGLSAPLLKKGYGDGIGFLCLYELQRLELLYEEVFIGAGVWLVIYRSPPEFFIKGQPKLQRFSFQNIQTEKWNKQSSEFLLKQMRKFVSDEIPFVT